MVRDFRKMEGNRYVWDFTWRRSRFVWEEESISLLRERLVEVNLSLMEDNWGGNL
jgi:hypothetical protein